MRSLRLWLTLGALALLAPVTATAAEPKAGSASGTTVTCSGYPVPPFTTLTSNGVKLTIANSCRIDSGTLSGVVRGIQYSVTTPDGHRISAGWERFVGSIAGRHGTADFRYDGIRDCFPGCPAHTHVYAVAGQRGLKGLQLDINVTGPGTGPFTYTGTYAFSDDDSGTEGGGDR